MALLEVNDIRKNFGKTEVLKGISFSLDKGEVLAIIGSSGSGKTTLLRCLNFLEFADSGTISVNSKVIYNGFDTARKTDEEIRKNRLHFGLVFQSFNLFPQYNVLQNVTLAPNLLKLDTPQNIEKNAKELIERVGLTEKLKNYPCELSGGQQQRVAIARALALNPDILCFDEPTSALDPELTGEVINVVLKLVEKKMTMLIVTHDMRFAREAAGRIIYMDNGSIVEEGTPEQIFENPQSPRLKEFLSSLR